MKDLKNMTIEELEKAIEENEEMLRQLKEQRRKKELIVEIRTDLKNLLEKIEDAEIKIMFGSTIEKCDNYRCEELEFEYDGRTILINEY